MRAERDRTKRRGAAIVEMSLVVIALFGLLFLLMDLSWAVFAKATLQHAVREGCRYAVTSQTESGLGHLASIQAKVVDSAMGFLASSADQAKIQIRFYDANTLTELTGLGSNAGGNLVVVSVENFELRPLVPLARSGDPVRFTVRAGDKIEASPLGIPPDL